MSHNIHETPAAPERLLRLPEVLRLTGLKRASLYRDAQLGKFPPPIKIGVCASAWPSSLIEAWIAQKLPGDKSDDANY